MGEVSGEVSDRYVLQVYVGQLSPLYEALSIEASKTTTAAQIVECIADKLMLTDASIGYELAEVMADTHGGQDCKERRLGPHELPVALQLLWPKRESTTGCAAGLKSGIGCQTDYKFCLRRKMDTTNWWWSWTDSNDKLIRDYFLRFLYQPRDREYPDLCQLPDLTEQTLLENLKARFDKGHIYTYVGSILIAVNPFKFYPIYNPKYVQLYQNRRLGELPPHIFAIADAAYQAMLKKRSNQCIVISGESGSGKTESTNLLLHHLTALSQKGTHGSGVEQTILGAGPVLEAFGNAKTKHNNNSSRFGKFIQVNYKENGAVHGAVVQKYLLEKSRIVSQVKSERNYHVFYYLLAGATPQDKEALYLGKPCDYNYLNQSKCYTLDGVDEAYEFARLQQSMEMVGFSSEKQHRCFRVLSAVLHLGNVQFSKKSAYHSDETVLVANPQVLQTISKLLLVKEETLSTALTCKRTKAAKGETLTINYKMPDAIAARDAMAKCLYGALFDWIVMQVNHALLAKKDFRHHKGHYIGVLDIFGFEDFGDQNNFEQFCINYANEHLQFYFNQHVFKYEQEEYIRESINWRNIDFIDNVDCLTLIEGRPHGLLYLLDDQCNFPGASNDTVLQKFVNHHKGNALFEVPPCRPAPAFTIKHYAGKVKYTIRDFREKNMDLMRPDIVSVLKVSQMAFVRELVGADPLAIFRWQILKAFFRAYFIFSKLRQVSKMKRGLNDNYIINEISNTRRSRTSFDHKKLLIVTDGVHNMGITGRSGDASGAPPVTRISKGILSKQALFGATTAGATPQCIGGSVIKSNSSIVCPMHGNNHSLCSNDAKVLSKANKILMKHKTIAQQKLQQKSKGIEKSINNLKSLKLLMTPMGGTMGAHPSAHHTKSHTGSGHHNSTMPRSGRKQTPTVTHQFHVSLGQLMDALNLANPFFVRCIKSNGDKIANHFDDVLVLLQLRYTGMLETVRIRQSGYSVRLSYEEFIQHYRILLPKGLLSSQTDVKQFLALANLNRDNYQIGSSKIFMRESEKLTLDERLHQEILRRIVTLQRWVRTWLLRRRFKEMRGAAIIIQCHTRRWMAQQRLSRLKQIAAYESWAANCIQKNWRSFKQKQWFERLRQSTIAFQGHCRGFLLRGRLASKVAADNEANAAESVSTAVTPEPYMTPTSQCSQLSAQSLSHFAIAADSSNIPIDSQSYHSDEAFLSKGSSQEELLDSIANHKNITQQSSSSLPQLSDHSVVYRRPKPTTDSTLIVDHIRAKESEDSSGIHEDIDDSDPEVLPPVTGRGSLGGAGSRVPPVLSHKRLSTDRPLQTSFDTDIAADDESEFFGDDYEDDLDMIDDRSRLDRRRNRVVRKLSLKKSKSSKSVTEDRTSGSGGQDLSPTKLSDINFREHRQLTKIASDSAALMSSQQQRWEQHFVEPREAVNVVKEAKLSKTGAQHHSQSQSQLQQKQPQQVPHSKDQIKSTSSLTDSVGALQKAKKTLKTFIGGNKTSGQSSDKSSNKTHAKPHQTLCYDSGPEEVSLLCSSSQRSALSKRPSKSFERPFPQQPMPPVPPVRDFSLMNGHSMRSQSLFRSGELCAVCENLMSPGRGQPVAAGVRCDECRLLFHNKCMHSSHQIPCRSNVTPQSDRSTGSQSSVILAPINANPSRPPRSKNRKGGKNWQKLSAKETSSQSANTYDQNFRSQSVRDSQSSGGGGSGNWSVTRTAEFVDPRDILITDCDELQVMDAFILKKVYEMDEEKRRSRKESTVDVVFKLALKEFRSNLISTYSVAAQDGHLRLTYKNLIDHFEQVIRNICQKENTWKSFPVIMGVNAFRGYLDQLRQKQLELRGEKHSMEKSKSDTFVNTGGSDNYKDNFKLSTTHPSMPSAADQTPTKSSKKRKRQKKSRKGQSAADAEAYKIFGHLFLMSTANIPTVCEVCSSLMWLMERIYVCRLCKMACHKKCAQKLTGTCRMHELAQQRDNPRNGGRPDVFGAVLSEWVTDECRVPPIVEHLITTIELKGLYTEGLYRKSGTTSKITELKKQLEARRMEVDLDSYSIHVLTAALKSFFREMTEPLMTYELYDDFLWSTAISDPQEKIQSIYSTIGKLPRANYDLLERVIFHLARVAQQESANRMNANSLAIVFAPCILRTDKMMQMQDKLMDIGKQTVCIECIISERLAQIKDTLADIDILDTACHTASSRLSSLRLSKLHLNREIAQPSGTRMTHANDDEEEEEAILAQQIQHLITEKNHLTEMLPSFRLGNAGSDDDMLSSATDLADSVTGALSEDNLNFILQSPANRQSAPEFSGLSQSRSYAPPTGDEPLNHLTKNRVSAPNRRKPSRFESTAPRCVTNGTDTDNNSRRRSDSTDYVNQYLDNDKPVMV